MRLQDIMSTPIKTVAPAASLAEARALMRASGIHHLVVFQQRQLVGIVSDRDLGGRAAGRIGETGSRSVEEVMTKGVVEATPEMTVRQAANLLRGRSIGCLVVIDRNRPVGIVTTTDLLELIGRGVERPIERSTRWTMRGRGQRHASASARHTRTG